jgi:crotonobetainyl-CoA:carnitine CoA-transferase CaiB-like acyl-CoA transferase
MPGNSLRNTTVDELTLMRHFGSGKEDIMSGPLNGIRVLDVGAFGVGPAGCGILGLMGADVIRIEPHTGDGLMFVATPIGGMGACYIASHFNKKNIILNLQDEKDKEIGLKLVKWADIVVENRRVGTMKKLGFDYDTLIKVNPNLVYISAPAYGTSGPFTDFAGADHYIQAASGFVQLNGKENGDAEIFRIPAYLDVVNSSIISQMALVGLLARQRTGRGQYMITSSFNGDIVVQATRLAEFFATNVTPERMGSANPNVVPSQAFRTLGNNYVLVSVPREEYWPKLCRALEMENMQEDPRFNTNADRVRNRAELIPILEEKFSDKPLRWWLIHLNRHGVPCGYVCDYDDIIRDPHVLHNQIVVERESPWGKVLVVNPPWKFSGTPGLPTEVTHYPDADRDEILWLAEQVWTRTFKPEEKPPTLPLEGIKVVDMSDDIAGAFCSMNLADAGADVVKVENISGDWTRHVGPAVNEESSLFMSLNRNKKNIALDTASEVGKEILYRLVREADVFIESYGPGKADKRELGYQKLRSLKHNIVYCSISPFGEEGPYSSKPASELELQGLSGLIQFLGEPGESPVRLGADVVSISTAIHATSAILAALYHRRQTGIGQKVSVSMLHVALWLGSVWIMNHCNPDTYGSYFLTGPFDHAETGYKSKDKAIIFGLFTNTEERAKQTWRQFCQKLDVQALLADPYFAEHGYRTLGIGREAQEMKPFFEVAFENWKANDLVKLIQSIGGMASAFNPYEELFGDPPHPQVAVNELIVSFDHPKAGRMRAVGIPYKLEGTPLGLRMPPPLLGEHTDEILVSLGYSREKVVRLRELGYAK